MPCDSRAPLCSSTVGAWGRWFIGFPHMVCGLLLAQPHDRSAVFVVYVYVYTCLAPFRSHRVSVCLCVCARQGQRLTTASQCGTAQYTLGILLPVQVTTRAPHSVAVLSRAVHETRPPPRGGGLGLIDCDTRPPSTITNKNALTPFPPFRSPPLEMTPTNGSGSRRSYGAVPNQPLRNNLPPPPPPPSPRFEDCTALWVLQVLLLQTFTPTIASHVVARTIRSRSARRFSCMAPCVVRVLWAHGAGVVPRNQPRVQSGRFLQRPAPPPEAQPLKRPQQGCANTVNARTELMDRQWDSGGGWRCAHRQVVTRLQQVQ